MENRNLEEYYATKGIPESQIERRRLELQFIFEEILGSKNVYYQPPENVKLKYPAIVYSRDRIINRFSNNGVYIQSVSYQVKVIDEDPDSIYVEKISKLPYSSFERHYTSDNLNHDVFNIY